MTSAHDSVCCITAVQDLQDLHAGNALSWLSREAPPSEYCWGYCCRLGIARGRHSRRLATCRCSASLFCRLHLFKQTTSSKTIVNTGKALFESAEARKRQAAALCSLCCMTIEGAAAAPSGGIGRRQEASAGLEPAIALEDRGEWIKGPLTAAQRRAWRDKLGGSWKWSQALPGARLPDVLLSCHMCLCQHTWHGTNLCLSWPYVLRQTQD